MLEPVARVQHLGDLNFHYHHLAYNSTFWENLLLLETWLELEWRRTTIKEHSKNPVFLLVSWLFYDRYTSITSNLWYDSATTLRRIAVKMSGLLLIPVKLSTVMFVWSWLIYGQSWRRDRCRWRCCGPDGLVLWQMNGSLTGETLYFSSATSLNWWTFGPFSEQKEF